ncbi:MBL fold metallo-hydrolase [Mycoplasmatota bacterium WC30]
MKISLLANDKADLNFDAEHGLSIYINHPIYKILFDTGYTNVYLENAKKLNIDLTKTEYIILSHGHYDHTGGLLHFPIQNKIQGIVIHEDAFHPKYAKENYLRYNGIPYVKDDLSWATGLLKEVRGFLKIAPCFYVMGDIAHKQNNPKYLVEKEIDDFHDEIILVLEEENELSLFMGCSHFGVINGIESVKQQFPNKKIKNLIAGMHLKSKNILEIKEIADYLEKLCLDKVIPLHCTGDLASAYFKERFKEKCILLNAGNQLEI